MATCAPYRLAFTAPGSVATAFTAFTPTTIRPSGSGVHDLLGLDGNSLTGNVPSYLKIVPCGTDGNNDTFDLRVYGWGAINNGASPIWIPTLLADLSVVLGNIAATPVGTGQFLADTITLNDGPATATFLTVTVDPQEDIPAAYIVLHTQGSHLIQFDSDLAGGQEGVAANALWKPVSL